MAPISKGLVRESLKRKVLPNNADTSIFNRKPQLYTIIHSLQLSYIPSTHASLLLQVGLLHVGLLHIGQHHHWRWDNIGPTYLHMSYSKPDTILLALGQHLPIIYYISDTKYLKHITLTPWVQNLATTKIEEFCHLHSKLIVIFFKKLLLAVTQQCSEKVIYMGHCFFKY